VNDCRPGGGGGGMGGIVEYKRKFKGSNMQTNGFSDCGVEGRRVTGDDNS
jgi:hypothetical protein